MFETPDNGWFVCDVAKPGFFWGLCLPCEMHTEREVVSANDEIVSSSDGESHVLIIQFVTTTEAFFIISLNNTWWC